MLNIVICDDNKRDLDRVAKLVDKFMKANRYEYKKYIYSDFNDDFMKLVKTKLPFRIYILDIETPSRSGIDVARAGNITLIGFVRNNRFTIYNAPERVNLVEQPHLVEGEDS